MGKKAKGKPKQNGKIYKKENNILAESRTWTGRLPSSLSVSRPYIFLSPALLNACNAGYRTVNNTSLKK